MHHNITEKIAFFCLLCNFAQVSFSTDATDLVQLKTAYSHLFHLGNRLKCDVIVLSYRIEWVKYSITQPNCECIFLLIHHTELVNSVNVNTNKTNVSSVNNNNKKIQSVNATTRQSLIYPIRNV